MKRELRVIRDHGRQYIEDLRKQPVSERFRGLPVISAEITPKEIESVSSLCPINAIDSRSGAIDLGRCAFCNECALLLPDRIRFLNDYRIAANKREDLIIKPGRKQP